MKKGISFARCGVFSLALCIAFSARAQDKSATLAETVVTATRSAIDLSSAPAAVTVVTSEAISIRNVSRISDALAQVPSLYLGASSNGQVPSFTGNFTLRGMDASRTLVMIDGVQPLQNGNSQRVNWLTLPVDDVERIEVVPGAFSSLYGSNSMGGVINVISKLPDQHELTLRMKKGFGDAAGEDASVYFRDKLSSGLGMVAGLSRNRRDGYVSEFAVRSPVAGAAGTAVSGAIPTTTTAGLSAYTVGDRGKQPWQQDNAFVRLSYDISTVSRVYVGFAQADAQIGYSRFNSYLTNAATGAEVFSGTLGINGQRVTLTESNFLGNSPLIDSSTRASAGFEGLVGKDTKLKIDLAQIDRKSSFPSAGTTATWNGGTGTLTNAPDQSQDGTVTVSFPLGANQFVVAGVSAHNDAVERTRSTLSNWRDADSKTAVQDRYNGKSNTTSAFVQDEISVADSLIFYLGARVDHWETSGDFLSITTPSSSANFGSRSQDTVNPKVSAVWRPLSDVTLRTSVGKSFRAPTLFEMYSTSTTAGVVTQGDVNLKPETGSSWELGSEFRLNSSSKVSATYYETSLNDMIYIQTLSPTLKQRMNAGKTKVRGLELGATRQLTGWLAINANVSWIDSVMLENLADPTSVGKRLTEVPDRIAYLGLTVTREKWSGILESRYTGKVYSTAANTDTAVGVFGSYDGYTVVNAKAGYQFHKSARLNLAINNVLDARVFQFSLLPARNATVELVMSF